MSDVLHRQRQALSACGAMVARVRPADLEVVTPCAGWDLRHLLEHLVGLNHGFAAAARGRDDVSQWRPRPLVPDVASSWSSSASEVREAYSGDVLSRELLIPTVAESPVAAPVAVVAHVVDLVAHAWDVGVSMGVRPDFAEDLLADVAHWVRAVPDDDTRRHTGALFAPAVTASPDAGVLDQVLTWLGRDPAWLIEHQKQR